MAHRGATRGIIVTTPTALLVALIAVRVLLVGVLIVDAGRHTVDDPVVLRTQAVASSPASPYRGFPVAAMPLETVLMHVVGGDAPSTTAIRLALLAFVADMAAYVAVGWGWGRRPAAVYLLLGLPLLPMLYQRFDLVSVAFAAWGAALLRVRTDDAGAAGVVLGLGIWAKLWPVVLLPALMLRRARASLIAVGALVLVGGAAWYLRGGKKAPFQVLTLRDAVGWSVEGTVGSVLRAVGAAGPTSSDGNTVRFGTVPGFGYPLLFLVMVAVVALIWWLAAADARETSGGPSLAAVAALLVFAPLIAAQYLSWMLPWAAIAFEGDERERRTATAAAVAIVLTGPMQLVTVGDGWIDAVLLLARNLALAAVVGMWLAPFALPRRATAGA